MTGVEKCLHNYVHVALEGIVICSLTKKILFMNAAAKKIFGLTEDWDSEPSSAPDFSSFFCCPEVQQRVFDELQEHGECEIPCALAFKNFSQKICIEIKGVRCDDAYLIFTISDRTKYENEKNEYRERSIRDNDTKLYNKRYFDTQLQEAICHATEESTGVGILFFDIDNFKGINDSYGHLVADNILLQFAMRVEKRIRKSDILARVGGDEFAVLAMGIRHESDLITTFNNIFSELNQPISTPKGDVFITISVGGTIYPTHCTSIDELKEQADIAMYCSKKENGNSFCIWNESLTDAI